MKVYLSILGSLQISGKQAWWPGCVCLIWKTDGDMREEFTEITDAIWDRKSTCIYRRASIQRAEETQGSWRPGERLRALHLLIAAVQARFLHSINSVLKEFVGIFLVSKTEVPSYTYKIQDKALSSHRGPGWNPQKFYLMTTCSWEYTGNHYWTNSTNTSCSEKSSPLKSTRTRIWAQSKARDAAKASVSWSSCTWINSTWALLPQNLSAMLCHYKHLKFGANLSTRIHAGRQCWNRSIICTLIPW